MFASIDCSIIVKSSTSCDRFTITIKCDVRKNINHTLADQRTVSSVDGNIFKQLNSFAIFRCSNSCFQSFIWSCTNKSFNLISCCIFSRSTVDGRIYHCNIVRFAANITIENGKIPVSTCVAYSTSNITVIHQNTSARAVGNISSNTRFFNNHVAARPIDDITIYSTIVEVKVGIAAVRSRCAVS